MKSRRLAHLLGIRCSMLLVVGVLAENDCVLLTSGIGACAFIHSLVKVLSSTALTYRGLSPATQFDWNQRLVNLICQCLMLPFNVYILFFDKSVSQNALYGYSSTAHIGFVLTIAFYLYDSYLYLRHPKIRLCSRAQWFSHHVLTISLLLWNTSSKKISAFPAATFLISSAGHIPNEIRWLAVKNGILAPWFYNVLNILCNLLLFWTCIVPPPYMMRTVANHLETDTMGMLRRVMKWSCILGTLAVYVPHCLLMFIQLGRTVRGWNRGPKSVKANTISDHFEVEEFEEKKHHGKSG